MTTKNAETHRKTLFDAFAENHPLSIATYYNHGIPVSRIVGTIHSLEREDGSGFKFNAVLVHADGTRYRVFFDCQTPSNTRIAID